MLTLGRVLYGAYAAGIAAVVAYVAGNVDEPYMDEIFHIPQAQTYCRGRWLDWDPAITTPPGLYLLPAVLSQVLSSRAVCSVQALRLGPAATLLLLPLLYAKTLKELRLPTHRPSTLGKRSEAKVEDDEREVAVEASEAIVIALFPVAYFFGYLFYTDVASLALVVASYLLSLQRNWAGSALLGALSLLFRQTNIVWVAFVAAAGVIKTLKVQAHLYDPPLSQAGPMDMLRACGSLIIQALSSIGFLVPILAAYVPVFASAAAFVWWNGGIVLGDKANHVPGLHIPQVLYFVAFSAAFLAPAVLGWKELKRILHSASPLHLLGIGAASWAVKNYTIAHPFVLADNRHYVFYVWRRVINVHPLARYALVPGYVAATQLLYFALSAGISTLTALVYAGAVVATLVPAPLIEPRYFIVPFVLFRLHCRPSGSRIAMEGLLYASFNAATIWVFVDRPFLWPDRDDWMRFMW